MGRRKIEIKAIKDDRNRSVTFLKRKGGLFKKAHELSVLCSVDVAVFIFGNNKKLHEYSSSDMRELIGRYQFHGGPNEHKGPSDYNGGNDDDEDDDGEGTPPRGHDGAEHQMMPPQYHSHGQPPFPHIRHHAPSASPPITNGVPYMTHHGHVGQPPRGSTPQPTAGPRPASRNDVSRAGPAIISQPPGPHPGMPYMAAPPVYQAPNQPAMMGPQQPPPQYPGPPQQQHHAFVDDRRPSAPHAYPPPPPQQQQQQPQLPPPTSQNHAVLARMEQPPPHLENHQQMLPLHSGQQHISPPPPQHERRSQDPRPPPLPAKMEADTVIKKMTRKGHSIFTPVEENPSTILAQHLASFDNDSQGLRAESSTSNFNRSQSLDVASTRKPSRSPPLKRSSTQTSLDKVRAASVSSGQDSAFTPPSRSNSLNVSGAGAASRPRGPRLTVQIPDGASEPGSAAGDSNSPPGPTITPTQGPRHNSVVLPPPSPSASALLSAGASGPPNPFARPPPQQSVNGETPISSLPSRFTHEFLPSPNSFFPEWNFRASDSATLPSPLNFATPLVGTGPSFLREDNHHSAGSTSNSSSHSANSTANNNSGNSAPTTTSVGSSMTSGAFAGPPGSTKRKSPEYDSGIHAQSQEHGGDVKRVKV